MRRFWLSSKEAYLGWAAIFGILCATIAIYNIIVNALTLPIPEFFGVILDTYREIFHFPMRLIEQYLHISIPDPIKDVVVLWTIAFGASLRVNNKTHNEEDFKRRFGFIESVRYTNWKRVFTGNLRLSIDLSFFHPVWRWALLFFVWPRLLYLFFMESPYVLKGDKEKAHRMYVYANARQLEHYQAKGYLFYFDLRVVFAIQLFTAVVAATVVAIVTGLG